MFEKKNTDDKMLKVQYLSVSWVIKFVFNVSYPAKAIYSVLRSYCALLR